jgi:hypothetical protein
MRRRGVTVIYSEFTDAAQQDVVERVGEFCAH